MLNTALIKLMITSKHEQKAREQESTEKPPRNSAAERPRQAAAAAANQTQAQQSRHSRKAKRHFKRNVVSAALCVHTLALIYGSKGPQRLNSLWSTELWEGGREDRPMVLDQTSNEQMNDDHK